MAGTDSVVAEDPVWERACSRKRPPWQPQYSLLPWSHPHPRPNL